jgi:hypothetical protein
VVAVEEEEEDEDQRCYEVGELEPLVAHRSMRMLAAALPQVITTSTYRSGDKEANVSHP